MACKITSLALHAFGIQTPYGLTGKVPAYAGNKKIPQGLKSHHRFPETPTETVKVVKLCLQIVDASLAAWRPGGAAAALAAAAA